MSPLSRRSFVQTVAVSALPLSAATAGPPLGELPERPSPPPRRARPNCGRGPYLQAQSSDRIVVRFRTDGSAQKVQLRYGDTPDSLDHVVPARLVPTPFPGVEDWAATVSGLEPSRAITTPSKPRGPSSPAPMRLTYSARRLARQSDARPFLALGDCGTNRVNTGNPGKSIAARNGFRKFNQGRPQIDGMLLLGDNAYSHGTDGQYQTALFSVYHDELKSTPLWPCIGNHEMTDDYFSIFTVPEAGEAGGVSLGYPNYYSFDYANIHFVVLDLWKAEWRTPNAPSASGWSKTLQRPGKTG